MESYQANKIIIYTDGGARGNPGPAAIGAVINIPSSLQKKASLISPHDKPSLSLWETPEKNDLATHKYNEYIGETTNNEAEYKAVILALKKTIQLLGKKEARGAELEINVDSELLYKQVKGEYKVKLPHLQKFFIEIWNLKQDFKRVVIKHVPREQNKEADALVNEALDNK